MTAGAPQPGDLGQVMDLALARRPVERRKGRQRLAPQPLVEGTFLFRPRHLDRQLGPRPQFAQDRALGPAQDERPDQRPQGRGRCGIAALHRAREAVYKALA